MIDFFKKACIHKMASGNLSIELTEDVYIETFDKLAKLFLKAVNGKVIEKIDAITIIMWKVKINNNLFNLVFDDYPIMMSLEPIDHNLDNEILSIFEKLQEIKGDATLLNKIGVAKSVSKNLVDGVLLEDELNGK